MKRKLILIAALFPLFILTACDDSDEVKLKKQAEALKTYQKSVDESLTNEQKAKQEVYRKALSGTKMPHFSGDNPNLSLGPSGNEKP